MLMRTWYSGMKKHPGVEAMRHTDYRTLIDRGRKAGLRTAELYHAMAARPPEAGDAMPGQADGNGFVSAFNGLGQRVFRPTGTPGRD
jgi:hypothetical protein